MKHYEEYKHLIFSKIQEYHGELAALNDYLADHPEISGQEYESSKAIVELLRRHGCQVEYPFAGQDTAFRGVFGPDRHTRKAAILAEYDALPEVGHACGHCLSGSISVLAALALQELQDELDLDVHIIGTPAEETYGAKCNMVEQGIFGQYDMASMVHLYDTNLPVPKLQALSAYLYRFHGRAAHASSAPWEGANAFNGAQLMFHAIDMLRQHTRPDAQFHGVILHGGEAPNIVPEEVALELYIRALDKYDLQELVRKVDDCARGAAIATQTTWDKEPAFPGFDNLKANRAGPAPQRRPGEDFRLLRHRKYQLRLPQLPPLPSGGRLRDRPPHPGVRRRHEDRPGPPGPGRRRQAHRPAHRQNFRGRGAVPGHEGGLRPMICNGKETL